jgi:hypothetical protein
MDVGSLKVIVFAGLAAAGVVRAWWRWPSRIVRRLLADARPRHVAELRDGDLARVRGAVRSRSSGARSPITGRTGVWFRYVIEQRGNFQAAPWTPATSATHFEPFDLVEDGVSMTVDGVVNVFAEPDYQVEVASSELTRALREVLRRSDVRVPADARTHYRFSETLVAPGATVEVSGRVRVAVDPRGERQTLRGHPLHRFLRGSAEEPVVVQRTPRDEGGGT